MKTRLPQGILQNDMMTGVIQLITKYLVELIQAYVGGTTYLGGTGDPTWAFLGGTGDPTWAYLGGTGDPTWAYLKGTGDSTWALYCMEGVGIPNGCV